MGDSLDEIMARHEAATACGCCCDDDYCAYVDKPKSAQGDGAVQPLPDGTACRRGSVRFFNENPPA